MEPNKRRSWILEEDARLSQLVIEAFPEFDSSNPTGHHGVSALHLRLANRWAGISAAMGNRSPKNTFVLWLQ